MGLAMCFMWMEAVYSSEDSCDAHHLSAVVRMKCVCKLFHQRHVELFQGC